MGSGKVPVCLGFVLVVMGCFAIANAQNYPQRNIELTVPSGPGSGSDIFARAISDQLAKNLGKRIAIINKPGGAIGIASIVNSKPDGYTLSMANSDNVNIAPLFTKDVPFDLVKDLTYIARFASFPQLVCVRTDSPFKSLEDVVAYARSNPKKLKAGTPGAWTAGQVAVGILNADAKVDIIPVPYAGGGQIVTQLLGGHIDLGFLTMSPIKSQVEAGKIRALAFFSKARHPFYPNIPTAVEKGFKRMIFTVQNGVVGPKGIPRDVLKKWGEVAEITMKNANVIDAITKLEYIAESGSGEDFEKDVVGELMRLRELLHVK